MPRVLGSFLGLDVCKVLVVQRKTQFLKDCCFLNNLFWILQHRVPASPAAILSLYQSDTSANSKKLYQKIEIRYSLRPVILIVFLDNWRCSHSRTRRLPCLIRRCLTTNSSFFYWAHWGTTAMISPAFSLFPLYHCVTSTNSEKFCKTNRNFITG